MTDWMDLYFDDEYDLETGKFLGMSDNARKEYDIDLKHFYINFTDDKEKPHTISKFNDIYVTQYGGKNNRHSLNIKDSKLDLITNYAIQIKKMMNMIKDIQEELLLVLQELFVEFHDPLTDEKYYSISNTLTMSKLDFMIEETRDIVLNLHTKTEEYVLNATFIYEAITELLLLNTLQRQMKCLEQKKYDLSFF